MNKINILSILIPIMFLSVGSPFSFAMNPLTPPRISTNTTLTTFTTGITPPSSNYLINASGYAMNLSVPNGDALEVLTTENSTLQVEILPVNGSVYMASQQKNYFNQTTYVFTPVNGTAFHMDAESFSTLPNFMMIETINPASSNIPFSAIHNITWTGNITFLATIHTTRAIASSSWDVLWGETGLQSSLAVTQLDGQIFVGAIAILLTSVGLWKHSRVRYAGEFLGLLVVISFVGLAPIFLAIAAYVSGLIVISLVWRYRKK